ncbi:hypothetical protein E2C01_089986 [Portunus trituberculatus]|uniref:Uncharacterized protein n=1 Tax=Portunus trituberculatus TaxID=210409 RepID=A0A5B7JDH6_PORTR|nr:hypothetical protein [Portunus trituberculatus]
MPCGYDRGHASTPGKCHVRGCVSISWPHLDYACLVYIFRGRSVLKGRRSLPPWTQPDGPYITPAATMTNGSHAPSLP